MPIQPVSKPPSSFTVSAAAIDNGADWVSTGLQPGDGHETGPKYVDRDTARSDAP